MPSKLQPPKQNNQVEVPCYVPAYSPESEKLPTLKQWIKKYSHEDYKFDKCLYPITTLWPVGSYGTANVVTTEFRIGYKCSPDEYERLVTICDSIASLGYEPVVKVDRNSSPGWTVIGNLEAKADFTVEAIQRDGETIGYAVRRGGDEF